MKRNRHERRKSVVYKLESLFRPRPDRSPLSEADLEVTPPHFVDGEIDDVVFVSVSETASHHACQQLRELLSAAFDSKKQIVILTHNIELLKATKLNAGVAAAVIKGIQGDSDTEHCDLCGTDLSPKGEVEEESPIITDIH